ncbi:MAG TPA: redoxin domain-containing protein [Fimbriimonadaceae bacterium]|nr:redoxin domain-containing protein [Fimbriimonadaceae bacterium]
MVALTLLLATAKAPEFVGADWLNVADGKAPSIRAREGKVTIVHFWTFACINCRNNLDAYARLQSRFEKDGVLVVGIHTPEIERERSATNVADALKQLKITWPTLLDPEYKNWDRWKVDMWPTVFVVDKRGQVRFSWRGELAWRGADGEAQVARAVEKSLAER